MTSNTEPVVLGSQTFPPLVPNLVTGFNRDHPEITIALSEAGSLPSEPYQLLPCGSSVTVSANPPITPIDAVLRTINFNPNILVSGILAGYTTAQHIWALPSYCRPLAVLLRMDVLEAAGIQAPSPDWTFDDFRDMCGVLQGLVKSGRVQGLRAVLAPFVVPSPPSSAPRSTFGTGGMLYNPGLWQAFAWGFGGAVATTRGFSLTDPGTVTGMQALVDLARDFSVTGPADVAAFEKTVMGPLSPLYAMTLAPWGPVVTFTGAPRFLWARLPRFPVAPVM